MPGIVLAVPQYLLLAAVGLAGTHWSVLLPVIINPFGIFLCRVFAAAAVPQSTLEAARLDGGGKGTGDSDLYSLVIMGSAVSIIPLIALVLVLQRFWRADLLAGGLKG
ncbi:ABC transporter permease family protein [Nonomuraea turcica]|uniref:hypothetical protein n=1 Tax=Nonomuraea sp. G32 TaxID=3067274 RepID=UPI00273C91FD|nr:hypothetical protein [Nonomuraea sp. G32]MDP4502465.1 hypothetical protein [Nonomuraea sp. G32]